MHLAAPGAGLVRGQMAGTLVVCADEFYTDVIPTFKAEGDRIFRRRHWMLQQDGVRGHQTEVSQAQAEKLLQEVCCTHGLVTALIQA